MNNHRFQHDHNPICPTCARPQLKEQASDSISVLEGALQLKKDFYVHTIRTLDLLAADAAANGETESSTAGLRISADELHCQVSSGRLDELKSLEQHIGV